MNSFTIWLDFSGIRKETVEVTKTDVKYLPAEIVSNVVKNGFFHENKFYPPNTFVGATWVIR
jgi:hypothetical protein